MRTTTATLPNVNQKNRKKDNPLRKKALSISILLIIILFLIFLGVSISEYLSAPKWTIDQYGAIAQFLDYDVPFDGKANLPNYTDYELNFDAIMEECAEVSLEEMQALYAIPGEPIYGQIIDEDSIVSLNITRSVDGKVLSTNDYKLTFDTVLFGLPFMENIKTIIGQTDGYSTSFVLDGYNDSTYVDTYGDSQITYDCVVNHCLTEDTLLEINDEFVYTLTGIETLEQYKEAYSQMMYEDMCSDEELFYQIFSDKILDNIIRDLDVEKNSTPTEETSAIACMETLYATALSVGMDPNNYVQTIYGMDFDSYILEYANRFGQLHTTLILIAEKEGLDVSEEAYEAYLYDMAVNAGYSNIDDLLEDYGVLYNETATKHDFIMEKLMKYLIDEGKVKFIDSKYNVEETEIETTKELMTK